MTSQPGAPVTPFGARLRQWRHYRRLSQLALAGATSTTPRHISFLETGRSRPSRPMVLRLAETLGVSLRDTNELLHAAGLAAAYPHADLAGSDLVPYRAAIQRLLAAHEPYPAMVLDRRYTVLLANQPGTALFGPQLVGSNFVTNALANPAAARTIVNWPEVAWAGLDRLRENATHTPFDPELQALITHAETALASTPRPQSADSALIVCPQFRIAGTLVRTIAMTARFDHAADITLDELRAELIYPLDDAADRYFRTQHPPVS